MTTPPPLPFAGTDEELEQYLLEFAARTGGWTAKVPQERRWVLSAGARGSSDPNTISRVTQIRRVEGGLEFRTTRRSLPWTRAKHRRLAEFREGQLADYLTARVRGSGPEKFDARRLRAPFAPFGSGVAALTASFAWAVLGGLAAFAGAFVTTVLASLPLLSRSIAEIAAHSAALQQAGALPLPSPAEAAATGSLGAAIVFAVPIAFLAALVHAIAATASELHPRAARFPQAAFLFTAILAVFAFFPYFPVLAVPLALLIPAGAALGAGVVWSRRCERVREGPPPQKAAVLIAVILAASLAGAAVPRAGNWNQALDGIALFRDAWLLGNAPGRALARTYYRYTLYTAEPLKEIYSADPQRPHRAQPIARCEQPETALQLRALGFTVTPGPGADVDVATLPIRNPRDLAELKGALSEFSRGAFKGGMLRELCGLAWHALFYAGPLVVLIVFMGVFAPGVSILFRRLRPQIAVIVLASCAMVTSLSLVLLKQEDGEAPDAAAIGDGLTASSPSIRHEAAFLAFKLDSTAALADPLLRAADDADFRVRLWACPALGKSGDPRALAKLVEHLDDPEIFVRYRAAEGLRLLRDPKAVDPLVRMARDRSWYEGLYALEALRQLAPGSW